MVTLLIIALRRYELLLLLKSSFLLFLPTQHTWHSLSISRPLLVWKSWRKVCHEFIVSNPGRVVTRYEFSMLFSRAWCESMTIRNVTSGFTVTGICPFQRKLPELDFEPEKIPQENGIAYIPLYSTPSRRSPSRRSPSRRSPSRRSPSRRSPSRRSPSRRCCNDSVSSGEEPFRNQDQYMAVKVREGRTL